MSNLISKNVFDRYVYRIIPRGHVMDTYPKEVYTFYNKQSGQTGAMRWAHVPLTHFSSSSPHPLPPVRPLASTSSLSRARC